MWDQIQKIAKEELSKEKMRPVCVDADGTVFGHDKRKNHFGDPIERTIKELKKLKARGVRLVLNTARNEDQLPALKKHLKEHHLEGLFDELIAGEKPAAYAYLDDKAVNIQEDGWEKKVDALEGKEKEELHKR